MIVPHPVPVRVATPADIDAVVATLTTAFFDDPVWRPAFPDAGRRQAQASALWRLLATSALRYPWLLIPGSAESVAVWIPPGGVELTPAEHGGLEEFLIGVAGRSVAAEILMLFEQFDTVRPSEPHFYLSLLATHDDHRGRGLGMGLLTESLVRIDRLGAPAYLESSNPANDKRYERVGFTARDEITLASGHVVTTMWRPAR
jgi:GNAT superfamily N-acetyltransferase